MTGKTRIERKSLTPNELIIMTKGVGGAGYIQTKAWSDHCSSATGINLVVKGDMDDTPEKYQLLKNGKFFASPMTITEFMLKAEHPKFTERGLGPGQFRIFYPLSTYYLGYAVHRDSEIYSPYDLKGKDVLYLASFGEEGKNIIRPLLAWGKIADDEVNWIPIHSTLDFGPSMRDEKGDVSYGSMIEPQWLEAESSSRGIRWIELDADSDPAGAERFEKSFATDISWGICKQGVPSALGTKTVEIIVSYYTTAMYPGRLVYVIVKWLHENYDHYKNMHMNFMSMTVDTLVKSADSDIIPLHDGTVKYLAEIGIWNKELESDRRHKISTLTTWVDAFQKAVTLADSKGITVSASNEKWLEFWAEYRTNENLPLFR